MENHQSPFINIKVDTRHYGGTNFVVLERDQCIEILKTLEAIKRKVQRVVDQHKA